MPDQTAVPLDADCPICDRQVLRLTFSSQAWSGDSRSLNVKYVCSSGAKHMPLGWRPENEAAPPR